MLTAAGRRGRVGTGLDCPLCDRVEPPDGLRLARRAGPFDETDLPPGVAHAVHVDGPVRLEVDFLVAPG